MPETNDLTTLIVAAVAQGKAEAISGRTRAAIAATDAWGVEFGNPENLTNEARQRGRDSRRQIARFEYQNVILSVKLTGEPGTSYDMIAKRLNAEGHRTWQGRTFKAMTVYRIDQRNGGR